MGIGRRSPHGAARFFLFDRAVRAPKNDSRTRVAGTLENGLKIGLKVHSSKRAEKGFAISGRLLDLARELRESLERLIYMDVG